MRGVIFFFLLLPLPSLLMGADDESIQTSSKPIGSSFYRHLAQDMNVEIAELFKFQKRGFGRAEIITLVLIAKTSGTPLKDLGKRRLKNIDTLKSMAEEVGMDYPTLYKVVRVIKEGIEARGDNNLPNPVFEEKKPEVVKPAVVDKDDSPQNLTQPTKELD